MASFLSIVARMIGFQSFRDCQWQELRRHHVQAIIKKLLEANKAPATINTYLYGIKGVASEAWTMGLMDSDTFQHIKSIKRVSGSRLTKGRALTNTELRALFKACEDDNSARGLRDLAMLSILVGCGLRRAEIVALNFESLDIANKGLRVLGKGNKERVAFVPKSAWATLMAWLDEVRGHMDGALFSRIRKNDDITGQRLTDQAVFYVLNERRIQAGLEDVSPHDLRRTFASFLLESGEDILTVRDAMGHSSVVTTQRYDHRGDDRLRQASDRMNSIFDKEGK